jgi:oligoendopeptidase F
MTTAEKKQLESIPQRADIAEENKWNLTDLYKNNEDWETDFKKAQSIIDSAKDFSGKLNDSAKIPTVVSPSIRL